MAATGDRNEWRGRNDEEDSTKSAHPGRHARGVRDDGSPSRPGSARADIGDQGELWFASVLPRGWVCQPPRRDIGKDGLIAVRDGSALHNLEFSVQIKTSDRPKVSHGNVLISGVSRSAVQYWLASPRPTLVVAVDITGRTGSYPWHLDLFESPEDAIRTAVKTITLHIPERNRLDAAGWSSIRSDLLDHYKALYRALNGDAVAAHVLATIHNVSRSVGNLIRIGRSAPPDPPFTRNEGLALLIEQMELRDLILSVRSVLDCLVDGSDAHRTIAFWLTSFEQMATDGHPSLPALPPPGNDIPVEWKMVVAPDRL